MTQFNSRSPTPSSASSTTLEAEPASSAIVRSQLQNAPSITDNNKEPKNRTIANSTVDNCLSVDNSILRKSKNHSWEDRPSHSVSYASTGNTSRREILDTSLSSLRPPFVQRSPSPVVPALPMYLRPESRILRSDYQVPPEVFTNERLQKSFCMFSAIVKGYLVRRLMKTERVQRIIGSMRDTMTIALQLHREAKNVSMIQAGISSPLNTKPIKMVTMQDVELHRRLLQQLFKDSQEFHNIFFKVNLCFSVNP